MAARIWLASVVFLSVIPSAEAKAPSTPSPRAAKSPPATGFTIVPQTGHSARINALAMTADESLLLSASEDGLIKYWDLRTGKEVRTVVSDRDFAWTTSRQMIALAADGRSFYSSRMNGNLRQWDFASGALKATLPFQPSFMIGSPDRNRLALVESNEVQVMELRSQKIVARLQPNLGLVPDKTISRGNGACASGLDCAGIATLAFSGDGKRLAVASFGPTRIWTWGSSLPPVTLAKLRGASQVAFSPDGQHIAASDYNGGCGIWNANTGEQVVELAPSGDDPKDYAVVLFTPDGRGLITAIKNELALLEVGTWKQLRRVEFAEKGAVAKTIFSMFITPRTKTLVTSDWRNGDIRFFRLSDLSELRTMSNRMGGVATLQFAPTGRRLLVQSFPRDWQQDRVFTVWNLDSMRVDYSCRGLLAAFSPDGRTLRYTAGQELVAVDLSSGRVESHTELPTALGTQGAFSPDGRKFLYRNKEGYGLWDIAARAASGQLKAATGELYVHFLDDSRHVLLDGASDARVVDTQTMQEVTRYQLGGADFPSYPSRAVSQDHRALFLYRLATDFAVQDPLSGAVLRRVTLKPSYFEQAALTIDTQAKRFGVMGMNQTTAMIFDATTGDLLTTLTGHRAATHGIGFSADGRLVAVGSSDGTTRVWPIAPGELGAEKSVILLSDGSDWLAHTDDGYFDASNNGASLIGVAQGLSGFNIDQFALRNNRPDILIGRLGGDAAAEQHYKERYLRRLSRASIVEADLQAGVHIPTASLTAVKASAEFAELDIKLEDTKVPLKRYNVYVNDVPLFGGDGKSVSGQSAKVSEKIELTRGVNKIEVSCFNAAGSESYRALTVLSSDRVEQPALYFLGFGVSKYRDTTFNLQFADKDALDLAGVFSKMTTAFKEVHVNTWTNEEVTPVSITEAKSLLQSTKPWDVVVLFIAGHGMHADDAEARYYYLTHGADPTALASTAAPFEALEGLLQGIAPRKKLFLMDTCESGERDESLERKSFEVANATQLKARAIRGLRVKSQQASTAPSVVRGYLLNDQRFIYNDLVRRSGAIVFSSSRGAEYSFESELIKNGFFTSELLSAWREPSADVNQDGTLSVDELRTFVSKRVADKTGERQHPTVDRDNLFQKFGFPARLAK